MVVLLALAFSGPARAGTISVTTTFDQLNGAAPCSLREAVNTANQDVDDGGCTDANPAVADTIRLAGGDYNLSRAGGEDANASGDLDVTEDLTIAGNGADVSGIDGNGGLTGDRVVHVSSGTLTISRLTVHDGSPPALDFGGGVLGEFGTTLRLMDSTVSGNTAVSVGGGINADATLTDSTVTRNESGGTGGGIESLDGSLAVTRSTVSNNDAASDGGGINFTSSGTLTVTNSTLSGNETPAYGGGLAAEGGTINLRSATINRNVANGGGIARFGTATINVRNTILTGNLDPTTDPIYHDWFCEGGSGVVSQGHNLLPPNADCFVPAATGDQAVGDPGLAQLANNGGPTLTQALLSSSPALNTGNPAAPGSGGAACPATDQRGVPRSLGQRCDVGAYERVSCQGKLVNRVGTSGPETLVGTQAGDGILGLGGNDSLWGGSGGDGLCGGDGNDRLFGEAGPDFLDGGAGTDTCNGGTESDQAIRCQTITAIP